MRFNLRGKPETVGNLKLFRDLEKVQSQWYQGVGFMLVIIRKKIGNYKVT